MSSISTHILDTAAGKPAAGVTVRLFFRGEVIGEGTTNQDGRISMLLPSGTTLQAGVHNLVFAIGEYFPDGFYPEVTITVAIRDSSAHYHVPLLISPFGYTTYRGS